MKRVWGPAILGVLAVGCSSGGPPEMPLQFEKTDINLGIVHQDHAIRQNFKFRVWDRGSVRIDYASTDCCGPKLIEPNLVGKVLEPGTEHEVTLVIPSPHQGRNSEIVASISTTPASPKPITLRLAGLLAPTPRVHPQPVVLRSVSPDPPVGTVTISRMRTADMPQLALDLNRSDLSFCSVSEVKTVTKPIGHPAAAKRSLADVITFQLTAPAAEPSDLVGSLGGQRRALKFAFVDQPNVEVPYSVLQEHPYHPKWDRLFSGEVRRGEHWTYRLPLVRKRGDVSFASVETDTAWVTASPTPEGNALDVRVAPGADVEPGRFEAVLELQLSDPEVPPAKVTVAGTVSTSS